ncbi:acylneuraminate cytidylyltransferase family protein [Pseudomonadales bacterium]|nr:acylneuraminate cytidylyltransferase family protein [Pseudomonadales bacterium]
MNAIAFIFARGGSKGLPGKNTRMLCGKPLLAWAIECAQAVPRIRRVILSTDSEQIARVGRDFGAEVPFLRPSELASDDSPEWFAWRHALSYIEETEGQLPEVMVSVPTTAPLRLPLDIDKCLDEYEKGGADMIITVTDAHRNPYFNMVKAKGDGSVGLVIEPVNGISRRQDAPEIYDMTTVAYAVNPTFVFSRSSHFQGKVRAVHIPTERAIDIDTLLDFEVAEILMKRRENKLLKP